MNLPLCALYKEGKVQIAIVFDMKDDKKNFVSLSNEFVEYEKDISCFFAYSTYLQASIVKKHYVHPNINIYCDISVSN